MEEVLGRFLGEFFLGVFGRIDAAVVTVFFIYIYLFSSFFLEIFLSAVFDLKDGAKIEPPQKTSAVLVVQVGYRIR